MPILAAAMSHDPSHAPFERAVRLLLASYPRSRPPLPAEVAVLFEDEYARNRQARSPLGRIVHGLESWMHRCVVRDGAGGPTLELGAGTLNHLAFESGGPDYDVVEPRGHLFEYAFKSRVGEVFSDLSEVTAFGRYRRIISIATLEHLLDLPACIARCGLLLQPGGRFLAGIPSEGGALWGLAWRLSTGLSFRLRTGHDYGAIMRHEHISTAQEIETLIRFLFREVDVRRFPLPSHQLSLYTFIAAKVPLLARCRCLDVWHPPSTGGEGD